MPHPAVSVDSRTPTVETSPLEATDIRLAIATLVGAALALCDSGFLGDEKSARIKRAADVVTEAMGGEPS